MGLRVQIFEHPLGNFSNGGVSSQAKELVLVNVEGPYEPDPSAPAAILIDGNLPGTVRVVPADHVHGDVWIEAGEPGKLGPMMGGSYVSSPDARFDEAVEALLGHRFDGAVPLHDRFETAKQYAEASV